MHEYFNKISKQIKLLGTRKFILHKDLQIFVLKCYILVLNFENSRLFHFLSDFYFLGMYEKLIL